MPTLQALLLCESMTTDAQGRHTFHNEFSQYTMGFSQPFTIVTIWRGAAAGAVKYYHERIEIVAPDGRVVAGGENEPFSLQDDSYRQVNSLFLENVDFTHSGRYELHLSLQDDHEREIKLISMAIYVS